VTSEGTTEADLLDAYPRLTHDDVQAALRCAAYVVAHEVIALPRAVQRAAVRFLADENLDFAAVRTHRTAVHDVRALAKEVCQTVHAEVIALASREGRILLTEDKDFGWLAFVAGAGSEGVILIRFPASARPLLGPSVLDLVASPRDALPAPFTVLQPGSPAWVRLNTRRRVASGRLARAPRRARPTPGSFVRRRTSRRPGGSRSGHAARGLHRSRPSLCRSSRCPRHHRPGEVDAVAFKTRVDPALDGNHLEVSEAVSRKG
jgi:hypothetical protein